MRLLALVVLAQLAALTTPHAVTRIVGHVTEAADLGTFNGKETYPTAINNRGDIVGLVRNATGNTYDAFLWTSRFGYERLMNNPHGSFPYDINARGEVVGYAGKCEVTPTSTSCGAQGFVWSRRAGLRDLGSFIPTAINDRGDMVGSCPTGACVMRDGAITRLISNNEMNTWATAINAKGDVVGIFEEDLDWGPWRALFWPRNGGVIDLGAAIANDINDRRTIVGRSQEPITEGEEGVPSIARVWTQDGAADLIGNDAISVNAREWVLVNAYGQYASVWNFRTKARVILNSSYGRSTIGLDMNDRGDVVGLADSGAHTEYGFPIEHVVIWRVTSQDMKAPRGR